MMVRIAASITERNITNHKEGNAMVASLDFIVYVVEVTRSSNVQVELRTAGMAQPDEIQVYKFIKISII